MSQFTEVFIGGLNPRVKDRDIFDFFQNFHIVRQNIVFRHGFCFVKLYDFNEATKACKKLNGRKILGDKVRVEMCHDRGMGWDVGDREPKAGGQKMPKSPDTKFAWYFNEIKKREDDVKKMQAELKYVITLLPLLLTSTFLNMAQSTVSLRFSDKNLTWREK